MATAPTRIMKCEHCGNTAQHLERGKYSEPVSPEDYETYHIALYSCSTCNKPSVLRYYTEPPANEWEAQYGDCTFGWTTIYPTTSRLTELPNEIQKHYQRALKVKNVEPASFAVMAGRTLEAICKQLGGRGANLKQKIEFLAKEGKIPGVLSKMADQIRILRNLAAHADDAGDDITEEDIQTLHVFIEALLEYIYIFEAKVTALESRLKSDPGRTQS